MANVFQSTVTGLAELKNFYQGPIVSQFNDEVPVLRAAEKVKKGWSGLQVIRPLKVRRNQGIGATSDGGPLPSIGIQTTVQATIQAKYNYLRFGITGPIIKASQSDVGSFVRSASYELEQGYLDLKTDANRQFGWDGTGTLARLNANVSASSSVTIQGRDTLGAEYALKFLDVGTVVDIVNVSTGLVSNSALSIVSISSGSPTSLTATIILSGPITANSGDRLIRSGSLNNEIQGMLTQLDGNTTTVFGVDRSQYINFQGNVVDLAAQPMSLDSLQQAYNLALRRGGAKLNAHYCDYDSLRFYQKLLTADKRFANTMQGDGGFARKDQFYLEWNGIPVVPDKDLAVRWFTLTADSYKNYVLAEMEFADESGSMYIAQAGADALEVRVRYFTNLFNEQPNANALLRNYVSP